MEPNRFGDIAAFVSAARAGSFTAAAATLGLTRSAVGKSIARLEARMAVRLLNRTTRKLSLTDEGLVAYERWRQILDDLDEVESTMAQRRGKPTGTLRLTAPLSFGQRHVLPILDRYLKQWPELRADIRFTDRFVDLVEEGIDVAVRIGVPKEDSQLLTRTVAWQQFVTCASPAYLDERGVPQVPGDLYGHDKIAFLAGEKVMPWRFHTEAGLHLLRRPRAAEHRQLRGDARRRPGGFRAGSPAHLHHRRRPARRHPGGGAASLSATGGPDSHRLPKQAPPVATGTRLH